MNRSEPLTDELIQAMFERRAERAAVGTLGEEILAATASTRQRSVLGLRLAGIQPRLASRPAWVAVAVLAALLGVLLAVALSGHRQPGPLRTGLLAFVRAGDVYLANPDGSNAEVVLHQNGVGYATVAWAPAGDRLAIDGDAGVIVLDVGTGQTTRIGGSNPVWAPEGGRLAVVEPSAANSGAGGSQLRIVDVAGRWSAPYRPVPGDRRPGVGAERPLDRRDGRHHRRKQLVGPGRCRDGRGGRDRRRVRDARFGAAARVVARFAPHRVGVRWGNSSTTTCHGVPSCATDVYVADSDGSDPVRLNRVPGSADQPAWSPDGRWIAYRAVERTSQQSDSGGSIADPGSGLVIVRPDGTASEDRRPWCQRLRVGSRQPPAAVPVRADTARFRSPALWRGHPRRRSKNSPPPLGVPEPNSSGRATGSPGGRSPRSNRCRPCRPAVSPAPTALIVAVAPPPQARSIRAQHGPRSRQRATMAASRCHA